MYADEREGEIGRDDLPGKVTCLNLIVALCFALKHRLRWEPYGHYPDLAPYIQHLDTYAKTAQVPDKALMSDEPSLLRKTGMFLGLPMAYSNPRKAFKLAKQPVGNLPLEITMHIAAYLKSICDNETLKLTPCLTQALNTLSIFNDVFTSTDRVLNTPLPVAYSIAISQITWVYVLLLPFQLVKPLGWVTIPATIFSAYIILGIAHIGFEVENPFGNDPNDLPLDALCLQIQRDIDVIMSRPRPRAREFVKRGENALLWPLTTRTYEHWATRDAQELRDALAQKPWAAFHTEKRQSTVLEEKIIGPAQGVHGGV